MFLIKINLIFILLICTPILSMEKSAKLDQKLEFVRAVYDNDIERVKILIAVGASVNARCNDGERILFFAVRQGYFETVKLLVKNGADISERSPNPFCWGKTPLIQAAYQGDLKIIKLLLANKYVDAFECDHRGRNSLDNFLVISRRNQHYPHFKKITKILNIAALKQVPLKYKNKAGLTPLMLAVCNTETTQISEIEFIPNNSRIRKDIVETLLRRGAISTIDMKNNNDETAIDLARKNNFGSIIKIFQKYLASSLFEICLNVVSKNRDKFDQDKISAFSLEPISEENSQNCLICFENINDQDNVYLDCGHNQFHLACLEQWKESAGNKKCPVCRAKLT